MDEKKKRKLPRRQRKQHDRNDDSTSYQHEQHHPLSIYYRNRRSISFAELAQTYPDFCEAWERVKERQREKRINCKNRIRTELYENHHSSCNHDSSTNLACSSSSTTDLVRGGDTQKSPRQRQGKESFSTHVDYNFNLALTRSLLHRDFCGMVLPSMPPPTAIDDNVNVNEQGTQERRKNLCPPVPQRLNYVCWVKELLYCGMDFYGSSDSDDSDDVGSVSDADGVGKKGIDGQASNGEEREVDKGRGDNDDEVRTNDIQKDQQNDWDNEATTATRKRRENVVGKYLDARCQVGRSNRNDRIPGQLLDHVAHSSNKVGRRRSSALTMRGNGNTVSHHRGIDIGTGASCIFPLLSFATLEMDKAAGGAMEGHNDIKTDMKCQRNPMADDTTEMWKFLATDVDELSVQCARKNVSANHLDNNVHVALVQQNQLLWRNGQQGTSLVSVFDTDAWTDDFLRHWIGNGPRYNGPVMAAVRAAEGSNMFYQMNNTAITCSTAEPKGRNDTIGQDLFTKDSASPSKSTKKDGKNTYDYLNNDIKFDFVMTNPPFYASDDEAAVLRRGDQRYRTDMSFCESTYPNGGEVGFVMDMIHDSLYLRQRISWYTSMLGRKSSLDKIRKFMRRLGLFSKGGVRVTEFVQGKACRWGIAWTFLEVPARLVGKFFFQTVRSISNMYLSNVKPVFLFAVDELPHQV